MAMTENNIENTTDPQNGSDKPVKKADKPYMGRGRRPDSEQFRNLKAEVKYLKKSVQKMKTIAKRRGIDLTTDADDEFWTSSNAIKKAAMDDMLKAIKEKRLVSMNSVHAYGNISRRTFYNWMCHENPDFVNAIHANRSKKKDEILERCFDPDAPHQLVKIALHATVDDPKERRRLNLSPLEDTSEKKDGSDRQVNIVFSVASKNEGGNTDGAPHSMALPNTKNFNVTVKDKVEFENACENDGDGFENLCEDENDEKDEE